MINPGMHVHLGVSISENRRLKKALLLDGDVALDEVSAPPWRFRWRNRSAGACVVHAVWQGDAERRRAANPARAMVRAKGKK